MVGNLQVDVASLLSRHRDVAATNDSKRMHKNDNNVFVISMDESRWRATQRRLIDAGFRADSIRRWPAVDGRSLKNDRNAEKAVHPRVLYSMQTNCPVCAHDIESWGAIGCYLSHWLLWRHVFDSDLPYAIVFEDDGVPRTDLVGNRFPGVVEQLVREAGGPSQFDVLRFEWIDIDDTCDRISASAAASAKEKENKGEKNKHQTYSANLLRSRGLVVNMCAYVITRRGASHLLERALPVSDPVDMYLTYIEKSDPNFVSLLSRRILTVQDRRNFDSQIATAKDRDWRRTTYCSAMQNDVLTEKRPGKSSVDEKQTYFIIIAILASLLLIAVVFIIVALVRSNRARSARVRTHDEKIGEGAKT